MRRASVAAMPLLATSTPMRALPALDGPASTVPRMVTRLPSIWLPSVMRTPVVSVKPTRLWPSIWMRPLPARSVLPRMDTPSCTLLPECATAPVLAATQPSTGPQAWLGPPSVMSPPAVAIDDDRIWMPPPRPPPSPWPTGPPNAPATRLTVSGAFSVWMLESSITTLPMALIVRLTACVGATLRKASRSVMSPLPSLPALSLVVMVTLLLAFSAWLMVKVLRVAPSPLVLKSGPAPMAKSPSTPLLISRSSGSISHWPARPAGAPVSTNFGRRSIQPPDVSMKPPSPPSAPPRALRLP